MKRYGFTIESAVGMVAVCLCLSAAGQLWNSRWSLAVESEENAATESPTRALVADAHRGSHIGSFLASFNHIVSPRLWSVPSSSFNAPASSAWASALPNFPILQPSRLGGRLAGIRPPAIGNPPGVNLPEPLIERICGLAENADARFGTGLLESRLLKPLCECPDCGVPPLGDTEGLMLLIEFEGMGGLANFVYELHQRGIPAVLIADSGFVTENCDAVSALQQYGLEVGGVYPQETFWDMPYDMQYALMEYTRDTIEACTGKPMRVFGSRYFAYDENTIKAAEALGIPYILARGTTGARATIYQPLEYDVKIFSVSNVTSPEWGSGSLCDYSYWARGGTPLEFGEELFTALEHDRISPVSHTYLGGMKAAWNVEYLNFFDYGNVNWLDLDAFGGTVDVVCPFADIPDNREVQYQTPHPQIPLEDEPNVDNPCAIDDFPPVDGEGGDVGDKLVFFHNNAGPMCLEFLAFVATLAYPAEEHVLGDPGFATQLNQLKQQFGSSEGVSQNFGYFPIIFIQDRAFSGFNDAVRDAILELVAGP